MQTPVLDDIDSVTEEEVKKEDDMTVKAFEAFDHDKEGYISVSDLKYALQFQNVEVNETDCYQLISEADPTESGKIQYSQYRGIVQSINDEKFVSNDDELLDAFVAMGGQPDGDGSIDANTLIRTIKNDFAMTIDIENLIK